jgi:hypothetical protein
VPAECKSDDLKKGVGVTIYHLVESIEEVRSLTSTPSIWTYSENRPKQLSRR